jgi:DNA-binding MarR family transcriptional regulator
MGVVADESPWLSTEHGRSAIERAAPGHARTVRRLIFDDLSPDELAAMSGVIDKVLSRLLTETGGAAEC